MLSKEECQDIERERRERLMAALQAPIGKKYAFTVYGTPVPQPRQRHRVIKKGRVAFAVNYTPAKDPVNAWKYAVRIVAQQAMGSGSPLEGPVRMVAMFYLPRPQYLMTAKASDGPIAHTKRCDVDNLLKSVCDALNGVAYRDDAQIWEVKIVKMYHEKNRGPRAEITLEGENWISTR